MKVKKYFRVYIKVELEANAIEAREAEECALQVLRVNLADCDDLGIRFRQTLDITTEAI